MAASEFSALKDRLRLPLIAAPMFLVSGPELIIATCTAGVIGSFPTANCRTTEELDAWLKQMKSGIATAEEPSGIQAAPICPNLIVHKSNTRVQADLDILLTHKPEMVITSVGPPTPVLKPLQDIGCQVFADVASLHHAEKAIAAGADGLVLLTAGAGGQTGWLNPFVFVRALRRFYDGPLVLAGGVMDGHSLHTAEVLGCDLGYMGTRFIATEESMAVEGYKQMLVDSRADDIFLTSAFTGLPANMLAPSILKAGLDPQKLPARGKIEVNKDITPDRPTASRKRWKDIWSAGHTVSGVSRTEKTADLVSRIEQEYRHAQEG